MVWTGNNVLLLSSSFVTIEDFSYLFCKMFACIQHFVFKIDQISVIFHILFVQQDMWEKQKEIDKV